MEITITTMVTALSALFRASQRDYPLVFPIAEVNGENRRSVGDILLGRLFFSILVSFCILYVICNSTSYMFLSEALKIIYYNNKLQVNVQVLFSIHIAVSFYIDLMTRT